MRFYIFFIHTRNQIACHVLSWNLLFLVHFLFYFGESNLSSYFRLSLLHLSLTVFPFIVNFVTVLPVPCDQSLTSPALWWTLLGTDRWPELEWRRRRSYHTPEGNRSVGLQAQEEDPPPDSPGLEKDDLHTWRVRRFRDDSSVLSSVQSPVRVEVDLIFWRSRLQLVPAGGSTFLIFIYLGAQTLNQVYFWLEATQRPEKWSHALFRSSSLLNRLWLSISIIIIII